MATAQAAVSADLSCLTGVYRSSNGGPVAATLIPGRTDRLRITRLDGRAGVFESTAPTELVAQPNSDNPLALTGRMTIERCGADPTIAFGEAASTWRRVPLRITRTRFRSGDVELAGELIEPPTMDGKPPLFVNVHGSESTPAIDASTVPFVLAAQGVASFVFDKRGTGASGGVYTQDFDALAGDAAAAVDEARRLAGNRVGRIGLAGFSQGGWVAPAAAARTRADFVVVGFGVAGTPLEQDAWQVTYELRTAGFTDAEAADASAVTDVTAIVASEGFDDRGGLLRQAATRFGDRPWYRSIEGQYSGELLRGEFDRAKRESPAVPWHYDWRDHLDRIAVPQLWVLAADDSVAPSAPTLLRLRDAKRAGKPITLAVFPRTDHGIRTYRIRPDGTRASTAFAVDYFRLLADWMKGVDAGPYGDTTIER